MSIKISSGQIIKDIKLLEVGNVKIDNNTISSSNTDGDLILSPNGNGNIVVNSGMFQFSGTSNTSIKSDSVGQGIEIQGPNPTDPWSVTFESPGIADEGFMPTPWVMSLRKPSYDDANVLVLSPVITKYDLENIKIKQIKVDNLQVDNNTISTTSANADLILDPNGTGNVKINSGNLVLSSSSKIFVGDSLLSLEDTLASDIKSTETIGALNAGNTLTAGSNLTTILKSLLQKIYTPTLTDPTGSVSAATVGTINANGIVHPIGSSSTRREIGTNVQVILTASLNRGAITGANNASGVWQSGTSQGNRSGAATSYIINGVDVGSSTTRTLSNLTISGTSNTFPNTTINYSAGPQPTDSTGANFGSPLPAGNVSNITSSSISGVRAYFYGASSATNVVPTTSAEIRSLTSDITGNSTYSISFPAGTKRIIFAYPATRGVLTNASVTNGIPYNIGDTFTQSNVSVDGASSFTSAFYRVYSYTIAGEGAPTGDTYTFTIPN